MKGRKLIVTLLVVVVAIGLLFAMVAGCTPKPTPTPRPKPTPIDEEEFDLAVMLGDEVGVIVEVIDETIRQAFAIEDQGHIAATLFAKVDFAGTDLMPAINLDLDIKVEASFDATTKTKNAVLLEVSDNRDGGLGVLASIFAVSENDGEYVYIGQRVWNSTMTWVKLSQADDAGFLANFVADKVFEMLVGVATDKSTELTGGLVNGLVGSFIGFVPLIAPLELLMPTTDKLTAAGFSVTPAKANFDETKGFGGTELELRVENLGDILGIAGILGINFGMGTVADPGLERTLRDSGMFGLIDILLSAVLGQSYTDLFIEKVPSDGIVYPSIGIGLGHANGVLTGIGLHYDYTNNVELPLKLDLGVKDIVISKVSVTTVKPTAANYKTLAKEAAIEMSLDVLLANGAVDATINLYAYPTMKINFLDMENAEGKIVPFVDLDLENIVGFATITNNKDTGSTFEYFADFNLQRDGAVQSGFKLDLAPVVAALGETITLAPDTELQYFIPLDAQEMWDTHFETMTAGFALPPLNAGLIDDIAAQFEGGFDIGAILGLLDFIGPIKELLDGFIAEDGPVDFAFPTLMGTDRALSVGVNLDVLMEQLLAPTGIIGESTVIKLKSYYNADGTVKEDPVELGLDDYLDKANVIGSICTLMNYNFGVSAANDAFTVSYPEEDLEAARDAYFAGEESDWVLVAIPEENLFTEADAIRIFAAVTGKTLDSADAYDGLSLELIASLGASDKIATEGITLSLELIDDATTDGSLVKLVLNLNIKAENTDARTAYLADNFAKPFEGAFADTSVDEGKALFDLLLELVMNFAKVEKPELA